VRPHILQMPIVLIVVFFHPQSRQPEMRLPHGLESRRLPERTRRLMHAPHGAGADGDHLDVGDVLRRFFWFEVRIEQILCAREDQRPCFDRSQSFGSVVVEAWCRSNIVPLIGPALVNPDALQLRGLQRHPVAGINRGDRSVLGQPHQRRVDRVLEGVVRPPHSHGYVP
jgi:hypothetical protein